MSCVIIMYEFKPIEGEILDAPYTRFLELCTEWLKDTRNGIPLELDSPLDCPVHKWVVANRAKCKNKTVPNTEKCPICGSYMCPDCGNHMVDVLSRVTGYLQVVSGWNVAKKQEFEDRKRYKVAGDMI